MNAQELKHALLNGHTLRSDNNNKVYRADRLDPYVDVNGKSRGIYSYMLYCRVDDLPTLTEVLHVDNPDEVISEALRLARSDAWTVE